MLAQLDFASIMPFALFGAIAAGAWFLLELMAAGKPRAEQRLDEMRDPLARRDGKDAATKKSDAMTRVLEKASPTLAKPLLPKNENDAGKLKKRLAHAGFRGEAAATIFLGMKFFCLVLGLMFAGGTTLFITGFAVKSLFRTIMIGGGLFFLPDILVFVIAKQRKMNIFLGLPDAIDLMVVCVEAGLGLDQAMRKVAEELGKSHPVVAKEFGLCNFHLQLGRTRAEVLHDLGERTGVDDLRSLASILIQADKFGSSVGQALRVQSDAMRTRRRQIAEEKAAKTAVKLIFPLVLFIFPGIFVVLVGPAAITMVNELFPKMSGTG